MAGQRQHIDIPAKDYPDVSAHITWRATAQGPIVLRGYAICGKTGVRKEYAREHKRTANSPEDLPTTQDILYNIVCAEIARNERRQRKASDISDANQKSDFAIAFDMVEESDDPVNPDWSPETRRSWFIYVRRNVLPKWEAIGAYNWTAQDTHDLEVALLEEILASKKSIGYEEIAKATLRHNLAAVAQIYRAMRVRYPHLPDIKFSTAIKTRVSRPEQLKSLPNDVRLRLVKLIELLIDKDPRLAMAAIIMLDCGLRTAEAAAVWTDVIVVHDDGAYVVVQYQVKNGVRTKILKSKNAYRMVPLSYWGQVMIERCIDRLSQNQDGIEYTCCNTRTLSKTIRAYLVDAGLSKEYLTTAAQEMRNKPDIDGTGSRVYDICAYILRRDWASRARNICGLPSVIIDALLGHEVKTPQKLRADLRHKDKLTALSYELERHIHNPEYSKHPGITPIALEHSTDVDLIPFDVIRLKNASNEVLDVKLDLEAIVNSESIGIVVPDGSQQQCISRYIPTHCRRGHDPIIGKSILWKEEDPYAEGTNEKE